MVRPLFVLGTFHSGTSILYRMLARHPDVAWFSQFSVRDGSIPGRRRLPLYRLIDRTSRLIYGDRWGESRAEERGHRSRPTEGQTIWLYLIPEMAQRKST